MGLNCGVVVSAPRRSFPEQASCFASPSLGRRMRRVSCSAMNQGGEQGTEVFHALLVRGLLSGWGWGGSLGVGAFTPRGGSPGESVRPVQVPARLERNQGLGSCIFL